VISELVAWQAPAAPGWVEWSLGQIRDADSVWAFWLLGLFSFIEYLFPPFPGDVVTVLGAFIVRAKGWSIGHAFAATLIGGVIGGAGQFGLGRWVRHHAEVRPDSRMAKWWRQLEPWRARVDRHGALLILVSRFLPVLRGPLLMAAGTTKVHLPAASIAFLVGAGVWTALLYVVGAAAGRDPERVGAWLRGYSHVIWIVAVVVVVIWGGRWYVRWRRARS
jgi:membrane protein DedA with SNARE-associated domain